MHPEVCAAHQIFTGDTTLQMCILPQFEALLASESVQRRGMHPSVLTLYADFFPICG